MKGTNVFKVGVNGSDLFHSFQYILTAAHCVAWGREILNAIVVVGAHDLNNKGSGKVTEHRINKVKYHVNYNRDTTDSDVALIELKEPIEYRDNAKPICLPEETESFIGKVTQIQNILSIS